MLTEYILEKSLDTVLEYSKQLLSGVKSRLSTPPKDVQESLSFYFTQLSNWCSEVSFSDLKKAKLIKNIYVELGIYLYPRRIRIQPKKKLRQYLSTAFSSQTVITSLF
jgi:hypothetical protein